MLKTEIRTLPNKRRRAAKLATLNSSLGCSTTIFKWSPLCSLYEKHRTRTNTEEGLAVDQSSLFWRHAKLFLGRENESWPRIAPILYGVFFIGRSTGLSHHWPTGKGCVVNSLGLGWEDICDRASEDGVRHLRQGPQKGGDVCEKNRKPNHERS